MGFRINDFPGVLCVCCTKSVCVTKQNNITCWKPSITNNSKRRDNHGGAQVRKISKAQVRESGVQRTGARCTGLYDYEHPTITC